MGDYIKKMCPRYSVDVKSNGMAYFNIVEDDFPILYSIDLKKEGLWEGKEGYSAPHPKRHFICHEDGDLVVTSYPHNKLLLLEWQEANPLPKVFYRVRQWEFDWWMSERFPETANAKIYNKIKKYINY